MEPDVETLKNLVKLLSGNDKSGMARLDKVVDPALANECIRDYDKLYNSGVVMSNFSPFTCAVGFTSQELLKWLAEVSDPGKTNANNLRICFGIYNAPMCRQYDIAENANRMSVFLWPYFDSWPATYINTKNSSNPKEGAANLAAPPPPPPVPPFNLGSLYP